MNKEPLIDESVFIAPGATVVGDVTIGKNSSVWYHVTIRGDQPIEIGEETNIQDNVVVHVGQCPSKIGRGVTVGHGAIVHGCEVGDGSLVGMGAMILKGAKIGEECLIGAGAVILEDEIIPPRSVVVGVPGKVIRTVTDEDLETNRKNVQFYVNLAKEYKAREEKE